MCDRPPSPPPEEAGPIALCDMAAFKNPSLSDSVLFLNLFFCLPSFPSSPLPGPYGLEWSFLSSLLGRHYLESLCTQPRCSVNP